MQDVFLYDILEVSPIAQSDVIRAAYRCLVQRCHPDRNPGDPDAVARMAQINNAYSVLGDPLQRAKYDQQAGVKRTDRRGNGYATKPVKTRAGSGGKMRPFVFRSLD